MESCPFVHRLKTDPLVFEDVLSKSKSFEIRKNDRDFQVNDVLVLLETKYSGEEMSLGMPLEYTGRAIQALVTYILKGPIYGLKKDWCIMSIDIQLTGVN